MQSKRTHLSAFWQHGKHELQCSEHTHITLVCSTSQTAIVLKINIILLISAIIEKFNSFSVYTASQVRLFLFFTLNRFVIFRKWTRVKEREEVCRARSSNTLLLTSSLMVKKGRITNRTRSFSFSYHFTSLCLGVCVFYLSCHYFSLFYFILTIDIGLLCLLSTFVNC